MSRQFRKIDAIVLFGILLTLLMVVTFVLESHAHRGAHRLQCSSNMRQVALALVQYMNTTRRLPPQRIFSDGLERHGQDRAVSRSWQDLRWL